MDKLPELPFEQVLSYLSLKDRLKARTVSRTWRNTFDRYPVKTLCYSNRPSDFILGKNRWVNGVFAKNFISSTQFTSFFDTFGQTILSGLKRLRLCDLNVSEGDQSAFIRNLNSFSQLEELDIIRVRLNKPDVLNLNLPMLTNLQIEKVEGIEKLTLETPRLRDVKSLDYYRTDLRVKIVHGESVERLLVDGLGYTEVKKLKNLQYLYFNFPWSDSIKGIDSTFLSSLQQLKEIHTKHPRSVSRLFEQKQRSGRTDLKIYLWGLLLNGPHDPAINALSDSSDSYPSGEWLVCLTENRQRLADEIPFYSYLRYSDIEGFVAPSLEVDLLKRFTDLKTIIVNCPVEDIERFLNILKNFENIVELRFYWDQPQDMFDRLPEHCAVQRLFFNRPPSDLAFLFRLKHLIHLNIDWSINIETVRRAFEELPALSSLWFNYGQKRSSIEIDPFKQFQVWVIGEERTSLLDLNAAIEFITGNER